MYGARALGNTWGVTIYLFCTELRYILKIWHSFLYHEASYVWDLIPAHIWLLAPGFGAPKSGCDNWVHLRCTQRSQEIWEKNAKLKSEQWRPLSWLFQISSKLGGYTHWCTFSTPNGLRKSHRRTLNSKASNEDLWVDYVKSIQSSGATLVHPTESWNLREKILNSKLSIEHLWVDYFKSIQSSGATPNGCTQRSHEISEKNAKLKSKQRRPLDWLLKINSKIWGLWGDGYPPGPHEHENTSGATQLAPSSGVLWWAG
jgi:hypothetical protein